MKRHARGHLQLTTPGFLLAEDEEKDQHVYQLLNVLPDPSSFL